MTRSETNSAEKRALQFADLDQMLAEADSLLQSGYISRGNWTLGQAASHVADWMRFPVDGFPKPPWFVAIMMWIMKHTVGPGMKRKILAEGFQSGLPTAPETVPDAQHITDEAGVDRLKGTVERVRAYEGELHPSPLFGKMDKQTLLKVTLLHAEHHFGWLEPKSRV